MNSDSEVELVQLTAERWNDFVNLFNPYGACGGCWCMFWKLPRKEFLAHCGDGNQLLQKSVVEAGTIPGLLAYFEGNPVGWIAMEPRENYYGLTRSRILKPVDDNKVWSITCFYVSKKYRNRGISASLISAAVTFAVSNGANIVEGYPTETRNERMPAPFVYTGLASSFCKAGFEEVIRRSPKRPIMRYYLR